jgi:uroporphyrinogen decarboxylase
MTSKERLECVFAGQRPDRYPAFEHFWEEAVERWKHEGFPPEAEAPEYFDLDLAHCGGLEITAQFPEEILEKDEEYIIARDARGIIAKHHRKGSGHTPHWLETPIKQPSDWWEYKQRLTYNDRRLQPEIFEKARALREKGRFITLSGRETYEAAWPVFGQVQMFMTMLEAPEIVKDAMDTWAELILQCVAGYIQQGLDFDGCFFYGDMGYRNGTLFSPDIYRELIQPAHKKIVGFLHDQGKKVILHSCGQIKTFIPMLIEVGFDALQPLEAKCEQDVRELAETYGPSLVFFGNMDVRELSKDKAAIKQEVEAKLAAFDGQWNYIFHSDHSIPPTVSFENYCYALETARNYLARR